MSNGSASLGVPTVHALGDGGPDSQYLVWRSFDAETLRHQRRLHGALVGNPSQAQARAAAAAATEASSSVAHAGPLRPQFVLPLHLAYEEVLLGASKVRLRRVYTPVSIADHRRQ